MSVMFLIHFHPRGEYKCDSGMFVGDVSVIVNIKTLKGRLIAHKFNTIFNTQWVDGGCGEEWKRGRVFLVRLQSSIGRESDTYYWTQKVNREDYGVDQY